MTEAIVGDFSCHTNFFLLSKDVEKEDACVPIHVAYSKTPL